MKNEIEVIIYRNRSVVFQHLIDPEKLKKWVDSFVSSTVLSKLAMGAPYQQVIRVGQKNETMQGQVNEIIMDEKFAYTFSTTLCQIKTTFQLLAHDGEMATRLICSQEITPTSLIAKLLVKILIRPARRNQAADLQRLKMFLDHGGDKP